MGVLGTVVQATELYPALFPLAFVAVGISLWAYRRKRFGLSLVAVAAGGLVALLYTGGAPALALNGVTGVSQAALTAPGSPAAPGTRFASIPPDYDRTRFSSTTRLHPRFPKDLPIPPIFRLETNFGGMRSGAMTVRFRFRGEGADAVADFRAGAEASGWKAEILAPHRMILRKDGREVDAWFTFPGHAVVLDIPDPR